MALGAIPKLFICRSHSANRFVFPNPLWKWEISWLTCRDSEKGMNGRLAISMNVHMKKTLERLILILQL
ncbi:hypothetical protein Back11_57900 [Paenibacillus baekrokdamisoli]|uniref:Uncharacterized protein n=1 Tax=Paenibacillus baekrokdamisoli TaxID=1712516 RepID=A0A3G9J7V7_9BACL|nr:hypothetical protein [Paenibacillus baekrokdamisoli]BBH24445.1 hypothetical protein Back11_57900 [Paenibacillus baekrokdamisoli]